MKLRSLEIAEIIGGNLLLMSCVGEHRCGGGIEVPFRPGIAGAPDGTPNASGVVWTRQSGESIDDLTLSPSVDAHECGHFHLENGEIVP